MRLTFSDITVRQPENLRSQKIDMSYCPIWTKALYPDGTTKGEVIRYYSLIAPVLLPHLTGRPVTTIRFTDGAGGQQFFEKNIPRSAPGWLRTVALPSTSSRGSGDTIEYALFEELPALVWADVRSSTPAAAAGRWPAWSNWLTLATPVRADRLDQVTVIVVLEVRRVAQRVGLGRLAFLRDARHLAAGLNDESARPRLRC